MRLAAALIASLAVAGCAGQAPQEPRFTGPPRLEQSQILLRTARNVRAQNGCAEAAPVYRVLSGFGEGLELAQFELGECLLEMDSDDAVEASLFRREALFWLERAAYAGNGQAQRKLAEFYGAVHTLQGDPQKALGWALVFAGNGDAELYGIDAFPDTFEPGLRAELPDEAVAEAEFFAKDFSIIRMAIYALPGRLGGPRQADDDEARSPPGGDQRQRRRQ